MSKTLKLSINLVWLALFFSLHATADDSFHYQLDNPPVQVVIPDLPQITLKLHPIRDKNPDAQLSGSSKGFNISIITNNLEQAMTAKECGVLIARFIGKRYGLMKDEAFFSLAGENTYHFRYVQSAKDTIFQLQSHLIGASGNNCIHVHVSRITRSKEDINPWLTGFKTAKITPITSQGK